MMRAVEHGRNRTRVSICSLAISTPDECFKSLSRALPISRCLLLEARGADQFVIAGHCPSGLNQDAVGSNILASRLPIAKRALQSHRPLIKRSGVKKLDTSADVDFLSLPSSADVVVVPLPLDDRSRVMVLASESGRWDRRDMALAEIMGENLILRARNKALGRDLEQRTNDTAAILDTANVLHSSLSLEVTMQHILEAISRVTGVPHSSVYLLDATRTKLIPAFKRTVGIPTQHGIFWKIKLDVMRDGFVKDIIRSKRPIVVYDADADPRCNKAIVAIFHNKSVLGLPLVMRDKVIGVVFNTTFGVPHSFSEDQVDLCFGLASSAAVAIENARLFEESQFRNEQLAALHQISLAITSQLDLRELLRSVVEHATTLLKAKAGAVALIDEINGALRFVARYNAPTILDSLSIRPGEGLTGVVAKDGKALIVNDYGSFPRAIISELDLGMSAVLAAPLKWKEQVIGVIDVFDTADSRLFNSDDVDLLERFAAQAAVAIQNARFVQEAARVEALRETARLKSEFLLMVSHELRSPLGLLRGYAAALNRNDITLTPEQRSSFLQRIDEAAVILSAMTRDILDVTKMESGQFPLKKMVFDISDTISRLIDKFKADKGDRWRFLADISGPLFVEADPAQIERVLVNLLDNATKYSDDGVEVRVRAKEESEGWVVVEVEDEGVGIAKQDVEHIFEKFYQGRSLQKQPSEGSGLGLYICKQIVEAHGGEIWVQRSDTCRSRDVEGRSKSGRGSIFAFKIPSGGVR